MRIQVFESEPEMGHAAAKRAASRISELSREHPVVPVVFATGASQLETLRALTLRQDVPWQKVIGFHMDEYLGIADDHPASFRRYMREHLTSRVPMKAFYEIDGSLADADRFCEHYAQLLRTYPPRLCLLGIGENGHLAFNDPPEADFEDPKDVKLVSLDQECRQQQVNERWFTSLGQVPMQAITLTIPALMRIPELILSVPGKRKAEVIKRTALDAISTKCPATIIRLHRDAHVYLDRSSARLLQANGYSEVPS